MQHLSSRTLSAFALAALAMPTTAQTTAQTTVLVDGDFNSFDLAAGVYNGQPFELGPDTTFRLLKGAFFGGGMFDTTGEFVPIDYQGSRIIVEAFATLGTDSFFDLPSSISNANIQVLESGRTFSAIAIRNGATLNYDGGVILGTGAPDVYQGGVININQIGRNGFFEPEPIQGTFGIFGGTLNVNTDVDLGFSRINSGGVLNIVSGNVLARNINRNAGGPSRGTVNITALSVEGFFLNEGFTLDARPGEVITYQDDADGAFSFTGILAAGGTFNVGFVSSTQTVINITIVPTPGTLAILAMSPLIATRRRR